MWRRRQRRLRMHWRHVSLTLAAVMMSPRSTESEDCQGKGGRGAGRDELRHGPDESSPPKATKTVYFRMDDDGEMHSAGGRAPALLEPRPQLGLQRHTGVGFELLLDVQVPQLGRDVEVVVQENVFLDSVGQAWVVSSSAPPNVEADLSR